MSAYVVNILLSYSSITRDSRDFLTGLDLRVHVLVFAKAHFIFMASLSHNCILVTYVEHMQECNHSGVLWTNLLFAQSGRQRLPQPHALGSG